MGGRYASGLRESFAALAAAELAGLRRFGYAVCGDWNRSDDLVQATLERMYLSWPRIHSIANPGAYARTVLARLAVSETRRPWWRRERVTETIPEHPSHDATADTVDRLDLAQALAGLTVKQRAVVVLRFIEDRSVAEVGEILGIAQGTVKRQSYDAVGHLRRLLATHDDEGPRSDPEGAETERTQRW